MKTTFMWLLVALLLKPGLAFSAGTVTDYARDVPPDYRHNNAIVGNQPGSLFGPRIAWAEPYALGKLKLLIILPLGSSHEAIEMRSRIPAEVGLITPIAHDKWFEKSDTVPAGADVLTETTSRLLSAGYRYDAIIIGKVKWSVIPPEIRNKILEKVKSGTALVWISPWDVDEELRKQMALSDTDNPLAKTIQAAVPLGLLPLDVDYEKSSPKHFAKRRIGPLEIRTGKLGNGNVVWLDYQDRLMKDGKTVVHGANPWRQYAGDIALTPFLADDDLYYDYYYSILGKALYRVAGKTTAATVRAQAPLVTVERQKLPASPLSFSLDLADRELRDWTVVYELRDRQNHVIGKGTVDKLSFNGNTAIFSPPVPRLSQGTYVMDVWALQRGAVLDWASAGLVVTDTKYLAAIQPAKEYFTRQDRLGGTVTFAAPLAKGQMANVELWDTYDRLVAVTNLDTGNGKFEFPAIAHPLSRTYRLVAQVKEKDFVIDQIETWVGLPNNVVDDYQAIMWATAINTRGNRTFMRQCRQNGFTGYYDLITWMSRELTFESADNLARNNLLAFPYCYGSWSFHIGPSDGKGHGGTLADTIKRDVQGVYPDRIAAYRRYGTMAYSTSEESFIARDEKLWTNSVAAEDYAKYLQERYGDIGKLNAIWNSKFTSFAEIGPISFMEAKTSRQPTRWMEQELHKVDRFNQVEEATSRLIQEMDPGARVSLDCQAGFDFDWPRMAKIIGASSLTPLASFRQGENFHSTWWSGYYLCFGAGWIGEYSMRTAPWKCLFQGGRHILWWANALSADLNEPLLCMKQAAEEYREVESGAGKLLISSRKRVDPILLLWSTPSYYAGILNPGEVTWEAARGNFETLFQRTGLDYQAVGAEFLETSLVYGDTQRVLILPTCQAISRQGVEKIRAFAAAGGVVIADYPPAVVDEYLRPYGTQAAGEVTFETCAKCKGQKRVEVAMSWQACPACGGTGQTMKGGGAPTQSLLEDVFDFSQQGAKAIGKGYGLFLKGSPVHRENWGGIRKSLIAKAGLRGDLEVQDTLGNLRTDVESSIFDNGRALFLGILPDRALNNPPAENLVVKLGHKFHVYNVRQQQYLGETDTLKTGILPTETKLLAFLPERISGLNVSLSKATGKPGDVLELKGSLLPASLQDCKLVVRIAVTRDGKLQEAYTKNLAFQGSFTYPLPLALNQEQGLYSVKVTEVISGYTQDATFRVK